MKGILIPAALLCVASGAYAGGGCQYGHDAIAQSPAAETGLVISKADDAQIDPRWLALIQEKEQGTPINVKPIVVHN